MDWETGTVVEESRLATTEAALRRRFEGVCPVRIGLETGTHSAWISRLLTSLGHQVLVADPRKVRLIYRNRRKNDKADAQYLARLARFDPALLHPIEHRGEQAQADLAVLRSRDLQVKVRVQLVNHVRSVVKSFGHRLPKCSTASFARTARDAIPESLRTALMPTVEIIAELSESIRSYDRQLEAMVERYPEAELLMAVNGVGTKTALAFLLVIEDPQRLAKSHSVGAYLGLVPAQDDSGESSPQLRITKEK